MSDPVCAVIRANPRFQALTRRRARLTWTFFGLTMAAFFGLILVATFHPALLATPLATGGTTSIGWPIGAAVIVCSWALTVLFVRRTNAETEIIRQIIVEATR